MTPLSVEIYCREAPAIPAREFFSRLKQRLPGAHSVEGEGFRFVTVEPAQCAYSVGGAVSDLTTALEQSWQMPAAEEAISRCAHVITVSDSNTQALDAVTRLAVFQSFLWTVLEFVHAQAIHCVNSQQVIDPGMFLGEVEGSGVPALTAGVINVRLFRVDGQGNNGRIVLDTVGMDVFRLPDSQCDFRGLQPSAVAQVLFAISSYLFEKGDIIETGHNVEGALPGTQWSVTRGTAMLEPERQVLDLNPGEPYYAGEANAELN